MVSGTQGRGAIYCLQYKLLSGWWYGIYQHDLRGNNATQQDDNSHSQINNVIGLGYCGERRINLQMGHELLDTSFNQL